MRCVATAALLLLALTFGGCGSSPPPLAGEGDAARAQASWPGVTSAELNRGRELFVGHCSACHLPPPPTAHSAEEWPDLVAAMQERAGLEGAELEAVRRYLITMSTTPSR